MEDASANENVAPLVEYLSHRDEACPSCGYNLRGLKTDRCPECHELLRLRVGLAEPKLGTFIAGLVGLAAGAGFSILLVGFGLFMVATRNHNANMPKFFGITGGGFVVEGLLALAWVRQRRRVSRWSLATRIWLVAAAFTLTITNLVVFTAFIR